MRSIRPLTQKKEAQTYQKYWSYLQKKNHSQKDVCTIRSSLHRHMRRICAALLIHHIISCKFRYLCFVVRLATNPMRCEQQVPPHSLSPKEPGAHCVAFWHAPQSQLYHHWWQLSAGVFLPCFHMSGFVHPDGGTRHEHEKESQSHADPNGQHAPWKSVKQHTSVFLQMSPQDPDLQEPSIEHFRALSGFPEFNPIWHSPYDSSQVGPCQPWYLLPAHLHVQLLVSSSPPLLHSNVHLHVCSPLEPLTQL